VADESDGHEREGGLAREYPAPWFVMRMESMMPSPVGEGETGVSTQVAASLV
jgi:hypothetical protein